MRIEKVTDCVSRRVPGARPQDKSSQDEKLSLRVAELAASPKMERVPRRRQIFAQNSALAEAAATSSFARPKRRSQKPHSLMTSWNCCLGMLQGLKLTPQQISLRLTITSTTSVRCDGQKVATRQGLALTRFRPWAKSCRKTRSREKK
jgi:hypothetical protein